MTSNLNHILNQYINLQKELISSENPTIILEQLIKLQTLLHNLFEQELFNFIPSLKLDIEDILSNIKLADISYKVNNQNQLILVTNNTEHIYNMISPNELINLMSSETLTDSQFHLANLYISEPSIFIALNLYFLQNS